MKTSYWSMLSLIDIFTWTMWHATLVKINAIFNYHNNSYFFTSHLDNIVLQFVPLINYYNTSHVF